MVRTGKRTDRLRKQTNPDRQYRIVCFNDTEFTVVTSDGVLADILYRENGCWMIQYYERKLPVGRTLTYYVDGQIVGSSATSVYWTGSPDGGQNGSITVTMDLETDKNKTYTYRVLDQTGFEYWAGNLNFSANTCTAVELTW